MDENHFTKGASNVVKEASDVWSWGCVVYEASAARSNILDDADWSSQCSSFPDQILTDERPFTEPGEEVFLLYSFMNRKAPGRLDRLLDLVPDAPTPEYAATLRLLDLYLPRCWQYEPSMRPFISVLRQKVFKFSFEDDAGNSVGVRVSTYLLLG